MRPERSARISPRIPCSHWDFRRLMAALNANSPESACVLVADDDAVTRRLLLHHLEKAGHRVLIAQDGSEAQRLLSDEVEVALFDLQMPGASGMECLRRVKEKHPDARVIMISGAGEIRDAVAAMKEGAFDYVAKPFEAEELLARVNQALLSARQARELRGLRQAVGIPTPRVSVVAESQAAQELMTRIRKIAGLESTVLMTGECGTGKTTLARLIHQSSPRSDGPFILVSCAALSRDLIEAELFGHVKGAFTGADRDRPGRVEMAESGTLFLDEIGDLPHELQPKLLDFLQERTFYRVGCNKLRKVNIRLLAATNQDLIKMVDEKLFRADLFHRLTTFHVHVPTLAERREDISRFTEHCLERIRRQRGCPPFSLSRDAAQALLDYPWPGNIRELENVLERATAFCSGSEIHSRDLVFNPFQSGSVPPPSSVGTLGSLAESTMEEIWRRAIIDHLKAADGNR
ncbi:MAG: sigma-54 dependent transcriptional regulator, partial [Planctomycetales bacterium]